MKKFLSSLVIALTAIGCGKKNSPPTLGVVTSEDVRDAVEYRDFIKVWHYQVTPEVQINVTTTLRPWLSRCSWSNCDHYAVSFTDELKQRDAKRVGFDCAEVDDKIIDRDLVLKVQVACSAIHSMAIDYWKANNDPSEFKDAGGRVWKRQ